MNKLFSIALAVLAFMPALSGADNLPTVDLTAKAPATSITSTTFDFSPKPLEFKPAAQTVSNPQAWSAAGFHNWKTGEWSAVLVNTIGIFHKQDGSPMMILGAPLSFVGFAGAVVKDGAPAIGGFGIGLRWTPFKEAYFFADFAVSVQGDKSAGFGGLLGFGISFGG